MKPEHIISLISRWGGTMRFFPAGADERIGIAEEIASFASDLDQVKWLVGRLPKMYREWPGLHEVRALFCSKFRPRDGFEADSGVYLEGVPSENASVPQIAAPNAKRIEQAIANTISESNDLVAGMERDLALVMQKRMEQLMADMKARTQVKPKAPLPTQADIEAIKAAQERNRTRIEELLDRGASGVTTGPESGKNGLPGEAA